MHNQAKDLKLEKYRTRLLQTRKEKNAKRELENARKKESKLLKKTRSKDCMKKFYVPKFFNLKVDIFFLTLNKLNIY